MGAARLDRAREAAQRLGTTELEQLLQERARAAARALPLEDLRQLCAELPARHARALNLEALSPRQLAALERTQARNLPLFAEPAPAPRRPPSPPAAVRAAPGQLSLFEARRALSARQVQDLPRRCLREAKEGLRSAQLLAAEYAACGCSGKHQDGADVDRCATKSLRRRGYALEERGRTSAEGEVEIHGPADDEDAGPCDAVHEAAVAAHEAVHARTQRKLARRHGPGTKAFAKAWQDPVGWSQDEVRAYQAEAGVYARAIELMRSRRRR